MNFYVWYIEFCFKWYIRFVCVCVYSLYSIVFHCFFFLNINLAAYMIELMYHYIRRKNWKIQNRVFLFLVLFCFTLFGSLFFCIYSTGNKEIEFVWIPCLWKMLSIKSAIKLLHDFSQNEHRSMVIIVFIWNETNISFPFYYCYIDLVSFPTHIISLFLYRFFFHIYFLSFIILSFQ